MDELTFGAPISAETITLNETAPNLNALIRRIASQYEDLDSDYISDGHESMIEPVFSVGNEEGIIEDSVEIFSGGFDRLIEHYDNSMTRLSNMREQMTLGKFGTISTVYSQPYSTLPLVNEILNLIRSFLNTPEELALRATCKRVLLTPKCSCCPAAICARRNVQIECYQLTLDTRQVARKSMPTHTGKQLKKIRKQQERDQWYQSVIDSYGYSDFEEFSDTSEENYDDEINWEAE